MVINEPTPTSFVKVSPSTQTRLPSSLSAYLPFAGRRYFSFPVRSKSFAIVSSLFCLQHKRPGSKRKTRSEPGLFLLLYCVMMPPVCRPRGHISCERTAPLCPPCNRCAATCGGWPCNTCSCHSWGRFCWGIRHFGSITPFASPVFVGNRLPVPKVNDGG